MVHPQAEPRQLNMYHQAMNIASRQLFGVFPHNSCMCFFLCFPHGSHLGLVGLFLPYDVFLLFSCHLHLVVLLACCDNGKIFVACIVCTWISSGVWLFADGLSHAGLVKWWLLLFNKKSLSLCNCRNFFSFHYTDNFFFIKVLLILSSYQWYLKCLYGHIFLEDTSDRLGPLPLKHLADLTEHC